MRYVTSCKVSQVFAGFIKAVRRSTPLTRRLWDHMGAHRHPPGINWMKHLAKLKVDYYLVGATDQKTAAVRGDWERAGV